MERHRSILAVLKLEPFIGSSLGHAPHVHSKSEVDFLCNPVNKQLNGSGRNNDLLGEGNNTACKAEALWAECKILLQCCTSLCVQFPNRNHKSLNIYIHHCALSLRCRTKSQRETACVRSGFYFRIRVLSDDCKTS